MENSEQGTTPESIIAKDKYKSLVKLTLICEAMEEYASIKVREAKEENENLHVEILEFILWVNDNTDLRNHDNNIEHYTNQYLNIQDALIMLIPEPKLKVLDSKLP